MSTLAKVFVIVNLILSVVFFGTSAALFATRTNWREAAMKYKADAEAKLKELELKQKELGGRIVEVDKQRQTLNTNYNSVFADKTKVEGQLNETKTKLSAAEMRIEGEVKRNNDFNTRLQDLEKDNTELKGLVDQKTKESDDAKVAKENAVKEYTRIRLDLDKVNEDLAKTLIELKETKDKLDTAQIRLAAVAKTGIDVNLVSAAPPIDAIVQAVKDDQDDKLVVLSVGRDQKVQEGFEFTIYRGDKFVGKVKVIKVWDDLAGARIMYTSENEKVQVGDKAATHI